VSSTFRRRALLASGEPATGGIITDITVGGIPYRVHSFVDVGADTFELNVLGRGGGFIEYLIVAGGGGGRGLGGGGGGGFLTGSMTIGRGSYPIYVGNGGLDAAGENSTALGLTAIGGGVGGIGLSGGTGGAGGSGGGGSGGFSGGGGGAGVAGPPRQGFNGGGGTSSDTGQRFAGGGGGGGSQNGGSAAAYTWESYGGKGGDGIANSIRTGTIQYYCGGGGGSTNSTGSGPGTGNSRGGAGGLGGGGAGWYNPFLSPQGPQPGAPNTGGGSGGAAGSGSPGSVRGGSGIVVIRYPLVPLS
jgi:hypothetical protein